MNPDSTDTRNYRCVPLAEIAPEVLRRGGTISFVATGFSMWPHIRNGDMVTARPLTKGVVPRTGWIIIYQSPHGQIIVHRVVAAGHRHGAGLKVRGDSQSGPFEHIALESVLGRIVVRQRHGKDIDMTSRTRELEGWLVARSGSARIVLEQVLRKIVHPLRRRRG